MEPITTTTATVLNTGASAHAHTTGQFTSGNMSDQFSSQPFSLTSSLFGLNLNTAGKAYSLLPDFVSKTGFGKSWSLFSNGSPVGSIGLDNLTNSVQTQGLSSKMATGLASGLRSRGVI